MKLQLFREELKPECRYTVAARYQIKNNTRMRDLKLNLHSSSKFFQNSKKFLSWIFTICLFFSHLQSSFLKNFEIFSTNIFISFDKFNKFFGQLWTWIHFNLPVPEWFVSWCWGRIARYLLSLLTVIKTLAICPTRPCWTPARAHPDPTWKDLNYRYHEAAFLKTLVLHRKNFFYLP